VSCAINSGIIGWFDRCIDEDPAEELISELLACSG
jgi:hypothetical protein